MRTPRERPEYRRRCTRRERSSTARRSHVSSSATTSSTTTPTWPTSSWPPSTRRSPTGSCGAASNECEKPSGTANECERPVGAANGYEKREMTDTYTVVNPATAAAVTEVSLASVEETDALIARAQEAFPAWRDLAPGERARLLRSFAAVVDAHIEELAQLEVINSGHTLGNARWEAGNVRDVLNYYSAAPERLFGRQIPVPGGIDITFREPLGVVGVIVPWNFPMPIAGWGFAPALADGNTVVLKPAELTPLTALRLEELALAAGLPEDVFQVLPGKGSVVGQRFIEHP